MMKKLINSLLCLIFISTVSSCAVQQNTSNVDVSSSPIISYAIIVETDFNDEEAYLNIAEILLRNGYTFRYSDMTLKSISTEFTGIDQIWGIDQTFVRIGINIQGEENANIVLRGWMRNTDDSDDQTGFRISKTGMGGTFMRKAWAELFAVASEIDGTVSFE